MALAGLAVVGDNCIDRFLPPTDEWLVGGNAVNVAVQLALVGRHVQYFGAVGGDRAGTEVRSALQANKVDIAALRVIPEQRTAYTDVEIDEDGERRFVFEEFGACALYRPDKSDLARLGGMRYVHIGWLNDRGLTKQALSGRGVIVSQDLAVNNEAENLDPAGLDLAFCSAPAEAARAAASQIIARGARFAIVTCGAAGSLAHDGTAWFAASAPPLTPEDTTGAGDAFIAGYIDAHVSGAEVDRCLVRATERAAAACLYRGGFPQTPLQPIAEPWESASITDM